MVVDALWKIEWSVDFTDNCCNDNDDCEEEVVVVVVVVYILLTPPLIEELWLKMYLHGKKVGKTRS